MQNQNNAEYVSVNGVLCWATFDGSGDIDEICSEKGYKWASDHEDEIYSAVQDQIEGAQENAEYDYHVSI